MSADALFEEFRAAWEAGERPDVPALLARAPEADRQELGRRIDSFLMTAPSARRWDPEAFEGSLAQAAVERVWESREGASGRWPQLLPALRKRAKIKRAELVERLTEGLGLSTDAATRERVAGYYHRMEHGDLNPAGVSTRVFEALAKLLGTTPGELARAGRGLSPESAEADVAPVMMRLGEVLQDAGLAPEAPVNAAVEPSSGHRKRPSADRAHEAGSADEIDRLFTGG